MQAVRCMVCTAGGQYLVHEVQLLFLIPIAQVGIYQTPYEVDTLPDRAPTDLVPSACGKILW